MHLAIGKLEKSAYCLFCLFVNESGLMTVHQNDFN